MVAADLTKYDSPLAELDKHHIDVEAEAEQIHESESNNESDPHNEHSQQDKEWAPPKH